MGLSYYLHNSIHTLGCMRHLSGGSDIHGLKAMDGIQKWQPER